MWDLSIPRFENSGELLLWMVALLVSIVLRTYSQRCASKAIAERDRKISALELENSNLKRSAIEMRLEVDGLVDDLSTAWTEIERVEL